MSRVDDAARDYEIELDEIAADLIRSQGLPKWEAIFKAREIIKDRRRVMPTVNAIRARDLVENRGQTNP